MPVETPIVLGLPAYHTGADRANTLPDWEGKGGAYGPVALMPRHSGRGATAGDVKGKPESSEPLVFQACGGAVTLCSK